MSEAERMLKAIIRNLPGVTVVDTSTMPRVTSGNKHAQAFTTAARDSEFINGTMQCPGSTQ